MEIDGDRSAIVVHVQNGGAVALQYDVGIGMVIYKAPAEITRRLGAAVHIVTAGRVVIGLRARPCGARRVHRRRHRAAGDRVQKTAGGRKLKTVDAAGSCARHKVALCTSRKIITVERRVLSPIDHAINRGRGRPLCVDRGFLRQRAAEGKRGRHRGIGIPAAEGVARTARIRRRDGVLTGPIERRSEIGRGGRVVDAVRRVVRADVVVVDQPVTGADVRIEHDVRADRKRIARLPEVRGRDRGIIGVGFAVARGRNGGRPSEERLRSFERRIRLVDRVGRARFIARHQYDVRLDGCFVLVHIGDRERTERGCVVIERDRKIVEIVGCVVVLIAFEDRPDVCTDLIDGQDGRRRGIGRGLRPAVEQIARGQRAGTRIVNDLLEHLRRIVILRLDEDLDIVAVILMEDDLNAVVFRTFLNTADDVDGEGCGLKVAAVRRRAAHQLEDAGRNFVIDPEGITFELSARIDVDMDLVLILRLNLFAVGVIERNIDRDCIDDVAARSLLGKLHRSIRVHIGNAHRRAGGEDALGHGCIDADLLMRGSREGLRRHFDLGDVVAVVSCDDAHHAFDDRRRIDVLSELGIPADERTTFNRGRFGQLADRRAGQNRHYDKDFAVLVDECYGNIKLEVRSVARIVRALRIRGIRGILRVFRILRVLRICGLVRILRLRGLVRILRLRGLFRGFRLRRLCRQIADQTAAAHIPVVISATGFESDFIHTDFGAAAVKLDDVNAFDAAFSIIGNGCQRQQLQHHDERYDDRPGASAEKDTVQL